MHRPRLVVEFTKMNGAGNDFIVIDNRFFHFSDEELSELARRFCTRRFGIGADGLVACTPPRRPEHDYRMRYVNADGSMGTMCGNGARCLARFARRSGIEQEEMVFETDAGELRALVPTDDSAPVRLMLPPPRDFKPEQPLSSAEAAVHTIWTGTEHAVCFVESVGATAVDRIGSAVRRDEALQPAGANVDFVEVAEEGRDGVARLRVRTYEKGVEAETFACGTGAIASAAVARLLGKVSQDRIDVEMPGGLLTVGFARAGEEIESVYLEGPAVTVFRGTIEV